MGDFNQYLWVKDNVKLDQAPVLEIGSKFYSSETSVDYRKLFPNSKYIGTDIFEGENVDIVCDLTDPIDKIIEKLGYDSFGTIICCSVLEHTPEVFKMAENITKLTQNGGRIYISVPFVWEYHGYPNDYWRFTPNAIKYLFKDFTFPMASRSISSNLNFDIDPLEDDPNDFLLKSKIFQKYGEIENPISRKFLRGKEFLLNSKFRKEYILKFLLKNEKRYPNTSINMVGIKN